MMRPLPTLLLHKNDSIVVAMRDLNPGDDTGLAGLSASEKIPRGHKIAIRAVAAGDAVLKFGQMIGLASRPILPGEHVHTHNLRYAPSAASHDAEPRRQALTDLPAVETDTFMGILRADGQAATRNYVGVLATVNCSATAAKLIADQFHGPGPLADFANVDGVVALTHKGGCTGGETGEGLNALRQTIAGYARHPNFAAVLLIGLGCEDNQLSSLLHQERLIPGERLHTVVIQEAGGTAATVRHGVEYIKSILPQANRVSRQRLPVSHLKLGLECGGSDGFSALTANPALGVASDILVKLGGTSVLSETPEIYGAENLLLQRAANAEVRQKLLRLLRWWERYAAQHNETLDSNPTPGNKAGGISTILEKSLGAVAKSGRSDLVAVYNYAETITHHGLVFMDSPGFDPVSVTGQVAGGANVIGFTTGRGSCFGCKPAPSLKLATNTQMFQSMADDMDLDCGQVAEGRKSIDVMGAEIYRLIIETASGQKTKSEGLGYGTEEFAPWQLGATL
jgi:altronate hydrolase